MPDLKTLKRGIRVETDGTTLNTKVFDIESGELIGGVKRMEIVLDANEGPSLITAKMDVLAKFSKIEIPADSLVVRDVTNNRVVQIQVMHQGNPRWLPLPMKELLVGDIFRMFDPDGSTVSDANGRTWWEVSKPPVLREGVWCVSIKDEREIEGEMECRS